MKQLGYIFLFLVASLGFSLEAYSASPQGEGYKLLGVTAEGEGTVRVMVGMHIIEPEESVEHGSKLKIVTTPADGWEVLPQNIQVSPAKQVGNEWIPTGDFTVAVTFTKRAKGDTDATYKFLELNIVGEGTIQVLCNGEEVKPEGTIRRGEKITVVAYPAEGWEALPANLRVMASERISDNEWLPKGDFAVAILFMKKIPNKYAVTIAEVSNGIIAVNTKQAAEGERVTLTLTPDDGYTLKEGSLMVYKAIDKSVVVPVENMRFTMPAYAVTITAEFEKKSANTSADDTRLVRVGVYPNPFCEYLQVRLSSYAEVMYELFRVDGTLVQHGRLTYEENAIETLLLPTGGYLLKIFNKEYALISTYRLIKR